MIKNLSYVEVGNNVQFPEFKGEKVYMLPFYKKDGLPQHLSHWQNTVDSMLDGVETESIIYLMIDQAQVKSGTYHRRPGIHVDGYWQPLIQAHGHDSESDYSNNDYDVHRTPRRNHHDPIIQPNTDPYDPHKQPRRSHVAPIVPNIPKKKFNNSLEYLDWPAEALILASNITASRAWNGIYNGQPNLGGDCSHIDVSSLEEMILEKNKVYRGNVTMLHESLIVSEDSYRTVVRLNVPGWNPPNIH